MLASDVREDLASAYSINSPKEEELEANRRPTSQFISASPKVENRISGGHYMEDEGSVPNSRRHSVDQIGSRITRSNEINDSNTRELEPCTVDT